MHWKTPVPESPYDKVADLSLHFYQKRDSGTGVFF